MNWNGRKSMKESNEDEERSKQKTNQGKGRKQHEHRVMEADGDVELKKMEERNEALYVACAQNLHFHH